jgi:transposase-like protein
MMEPTRARPKPHNIWHRDEVYLKIDNYLVHLWHAVDAKDEVLAELVQTRRINKRRTNGSARSRHPPSRLA